jgi:hypothetical protein
MSLSWLTAGLTMAPNLETLHLVLFCSSQYYSFADPEESIEPTTTSAQPSATDSLRNHIRNVEIRESGRLKRVSQLLPFIKECCDLTSFPNLRTIILHVDSPTPMKFFSESVADFEWRKTEPKSFVSCENKGYCGGHNQRFSEHTFKRYKSATSSTDVY